MTNSEETRPFMEPTQISWMQTPNTAIAPPAEPAAPVEDDSWGEEDTNSEDTAGYDDEESDEDEESHEDEESYGYEVLSEDAESDDDDFDGEEIHWGHRAFADAHLIFAATIRDEVRAANPRARTMEIVAIMAKRWREESAQFIERMAEEKALARRRAAGEPMLFGSDSDSDYDF